MDSMRIASGLRATESHQFFFLDTEDFSLAEPLAFNFQRFHTQPIVCNTTYGSPCETNGCFRSKAMFYNTEPLFFLNRTYIFQHETFFLFPKRNQRFLITKNFLKTKPIFRAIQIGVET